VVRRVDADVQAKMTMSMAWYDVLLELNAAPGKRLRMQDLGEVVVLSRTRVSRIVDELVAEGLVAREANDEDRRSFYAAITGDGRKRLRRAAPVYLQAIREHFVAVLDPQDLAVVGAAMSALIDPVTPAPPATKGSARFKGEGRRRPVAPTALELEEARDVGAGEHEVRVPGLAD
jgi:DNA-binding MarR family transcriptional regulator